MTSEEELIQVLEEIEATEMKLLGLEDKYATLRQKIVCERMPEILENGDYKNKNYPEFQSFIEVEKNPYRRK